MSDWIVSGIVGQMLKDILLLAIAIIVIVGLSIFFSWPLILYCWHYWFGN